MHVPEPQATTPSSWRPATSLWATPGAALGILEQAYPAGTPGCEEYAEAFTAMCELVAEPSPVPALPTHTFELTTANSLTGIPVPNPGPDQIERVVRNLNANRFYTLLQRSDGVYAQVGVGPTAGVGPGVYALEHREGEHLRADTTDQDKAVHFLQRSAPATTGTHQWRRLEL